MAEQALQPSSEPPYSRATSSQSFSASDDLVAELTVKIGDVRRTSRKHISITTFQFSIMDGFERFRTLINAKTAEELQNFQGPEEYTREDQAIYIRPGVHSKQSELVELTSRNFEPRITRSYRNFLKRKVGNDGFKCDILTYVKKASTAAKKQRQEEVQQAIGSGFYPFAAQSGRGLFPSMHDVTGSVMAASRRLQVPGLVMQGVPTHLSSGPAELPQHVEGDSGTFGASRVHADPTTGSHSVTSAREVNRASQRFSALSTGSPPAGGKRKRSDADLWQPPVPPLYSVGGTSVPPLQFPHIRHSVSSNIASDASEYRAIRMILNGTIVAVDVNLRDLLVAFEVARRHDTGEFTSSDFSREGSTMQSRQSPSSSNVASTRV